MTHKDAVRFNLTNETQSMIGLNSFPCVDGLTLMEDQNLIGFVGSHSVLCNFVQQNTFEIILTRSTEHDDHKGINEPFVDMR